MSIIVGATLVVALLRANEKGGHEGRPYDCHAATLRNRQQRLLAWGELHVDRGEQRRGPGVVAHQQHQVDELVRPKSLLHLGERLGRDLVVAPELAAEL